MTDSFIQALDQLRSLTTKTIDDFCAVPNVREQFTSLMMITRELGISNEYNQAMRKLLVVTDRYANSAVRGEAYHKLQTELGVIRDMLSNQAKFVAEIPTRPTLVSHQPSIVVEPRRKLDAGYIAKIWRWVKQKTSEIIVQVIAGIIILLFGLLLAI